MEMRGVTVRRHVRVATGSSVSRVRVSGVAVGKFSANHWRTLVIVGITQKGTRSPSLAGVVAAVGWVVQIIMIRMGLRCLSLHPL